MRKKAPFAFDLRGRVKSLCGRLMLAALIASLAPVMGYSPENKVEKIFLKLQQSRQAKPAPEKYEISEKDLNEYIADSIQKNQPLGLRKLMIELWNNNTFYARALVNGDDIKVEGIAGKVLRSMIKGNQLIETEGKIQMVDQKLKYSLENTKINGLIIPSSLANQLVTWLIKDPINNERGGNPIGLPYGISQVRINKKRLIIEQ